MDTNTQQIIDDLFQRIQQTETQNRNRDRDAESLIEKHVVAQPSAPYYMAQTMIMQEATIKQLHAQVATLQQQLQVTQQKSSGGFFSNLFGGNRPQSNPWQGNPQQPPYNQGYNNPYGAPQSNYGPPPTGGNYGRGNSFLGGALKTAAGVAGGVVLGNLMMDMFSHHHPEEIVNIINENPMDNSTMGGINDPMQDTDFMPEDRYQGMDNGNFVDTGFDPNTSNNGFGDSDSFDDPFSGDGGGFDDFDDFDNFS